MASHMDPRRDADLANDEGEFLLAFSRTYAEGFLDDDDLSEIRTAEALEETQDEFQPFVEEDPLGSSRGILFGTAGGLLIYLIVILLTLFLV